MPHNYVAGRKDLRPAAGPHTPARAGSHSRRSQPTSPRCPSPNAPNRPNVSKAAAHDTISGSAQDVLSGLEGLNQFITSPTPGSGTIQPPARGLYRDGPRRIRRECGGEKTYLFSPMQARNLIAATRRLTQAQRTAAATASLVVPC